MPVYVIGQHYLNITSADCLSSFEFRIFILAPGVCISMLSCFAYCSHMQPVICCDYPVSMTYSLCARQRLSSDLDIYAPVTVVITAGWGYIYYPMRDRERERERESSVF